MRNFSSIVLVVLLSVFMFSSSIYGAMKPKYGGKLTVITGAGPQVIGWYPKMGPGDTSAVFPGLESILNLSPDRTWEPELAESYKVEPEKKKITFKIRKGVKFHDGSMLTPEVVKWNYDINIAGHKLQFADQIERTAVEGDNFVIYVKSYQPLMAAAYGWLAIMSKQAYDDHGEEWMMTHFVGTGPYKQVDWKRDVHFKWERFDDYWQEGKPYLDAVEYKYIPDTVTASSLMLAKVGDIWLNTPLKEQYDGQSQGLVRRASWPGFPTIIYMNTKDKTSPTYKKEVREAVEYAIDKAALAKAIGYGFSKPVYQFHPEGEWAHDPTYNGRVYNPEKARQLLKKAGYAKGLKLDLLMPQGDMTGGEAIKAFLGDVGIRVHLDVADPGRFYGSIFGMGWKHMALLFCGVDSNSLETFHSWFGHNPRSNLASFERPAELLKMSRDSLKILDEAGQKKMLQRISRFIAEEALFIPTAYTPQGYMTQKGVHTNYMDTGFIRWQYADVWKE